MDFHSFSFTRLSLHNSVSHVTRTTVVPRSLWTILSAFRGSWPLLHNAVFSSAKYIHRLMVNCPLPSLYTTWGIRYNDDHTYIRLGCRSFPLTHTFPLSEITFIRILILRTKPVCKTNNKRNEGYCLNSLILLRKAVVTYDPSSKSTFCSRYFHTWSCQNITPWIITPEKKSPIIFCLLFSDGQKHLMEITTHCI